MDREDGSRSDSGFAPGQVQGLAPFVLVSAPQFLHW